MDAQSVERKKITEEEFRSCYPDVSIQHLSDKATPKVTTSPSVEKRPVSKAPIKAAAMPRSGAATKSPVRTPVAKPQNTPAKTNSPALKVNVPQLSQKTLIVQPSPAVSKSPIVNKPLVTKTPVAVKASVVAKTPVQTTPVQVIKSPAGVKVVPVKGTAPALKAAPLKAANVKPQQVVKQHPNVAKLPSKSTPATSASKEDSPDQSTMTVYTYHMPQSSQRSNQLTIEKIDQQQRIPVVLDSNNQVVLQQVINNGQVVVQNRVTPAETTLQSVVIGSTAQTSSSVVPGVEITTSEPLQALQVTQQVTLFRPKGNTFTVDDVKKQLNKQSAMTNVVSSTTNSIPTPAQSPQTEKKVVASTREQAPAPSPVRQSNRVTSQLRAPPQPPQQQQQQQQVQKTVNARSYPSTRGQVKKVSPKREIPVQKVAPKRELPMQKVSPMPPPPTPPEMLLGSEEEVTTSENRPIETVRGETKVIVILPSGLKKEVTINENFPPDATLNDFLKAINYPMPANATNMTAEVITDGVGESEQDDMENNEVQWENSENPGPELGEIVNDEIEAGEVHEEIVVQLSKEGELQNDMKNEAYKEGYLAVCGFCGYTSINFSHCQRCSRPIPSDCKTVLDNFTQKVGISDEDKTPHSNTELPKFPLDELFLKSRKTKADSLSDDSPKKKRVCRKKRAEEPVCLTISDDEELLGLAALQQSRRDSQLHEETFHSDSNSQLSSCDKEPVITDEMVAEMKRSISGGGCQDTDDSMDDSTTKQTVLQCRTVRIGSYKVVPKDKVIITPKGLRVTVPVLNSDQFVELKIMLPEIIKVLIHFGRGMPVLFFYTRPAAAAKIRKALKMEDRNGFYYDSTSSDETHRRITLLPDKIDEDCKQTLKKIFCSPDHNTFAELTGKEANDILVKASPKEVQAFIMKKQPNNQPQPPPVFNGQNIQTIMVYPPPPEKGGIPINTEDYACLGEDQFLNDVIIDFYLKYVVEKTLSPVDRARTHVFSSFFYKRLTTKPPPKRKFMNAIESDPATTPAAKRHSRVKSWTKNVDLFSKDFIVIPINESSHWFLAIICFPGLTGPVRFSDNTPIEFPGRKKNQVLDGNQAVTYGSTTITKVTPSVMSMGSLDMVNDDGEDRDEADGENENMDVPDEDEEILKSANPEIKEEPDENQPMTLRSTRREPIKQPCILVFDSLAGASRARVVATLRDYLRVEYEVKHGEGRDFSGEVMKGTNVRCPQQTNYTDCGLYVLQYVEAFFQMPISDYRIPIKQLQHWFQADIVSRKRYEIQQLLHRLMQEQNLDLETLNLPHLNLRPEGKRMVDYSGTEEEEEEEDDEEEPMCEEEEDEMLEDEDYPDEDMDPEHDDMEEGEIGHHDEDPDGFIDPNMEHEDHELDGEVVDYGMDEDEEEEPQEDEMDKELDEIVECNPSKRKVLRTIRIPRLTSKNNMTDDT